MIEFFKRFMEAIIRPFENFRDASGHDQFGLILTFWGILLVSTLTIGSVFGETSKVHCPNCGLVFEVARVAEQESHTQDYKVLTTPVGK